MKKVLLLLPVMIVLFAACAPAEEEAPLENVNVNGQQGIKVDEDAEIVDDVPEDEMIVGEDEVVVPQDEVIDN